MRPTLCKETKNSKLPEKTFVSKVQKHLHFHSEYIAPEFKTLLYIHLSFLKTAEHTRLLHLMKMLCIFSFEVQTSLLKYLIEP